MNVTRGDGKAVRPLLGADFMSNIWGHCKLTTAVRLCGWYRNKRRSKYMRRYSKASGKSEERTVSSAQQREI